MGRWYLVRHGQTDSNAEGRLQGHTDTNLNAEGRRQAEALAARLAPISFAAAYTSDLSRTRETAGAILDGRSGKFESLPDLREASHGAWEGLTYDEARERDVAAYERLMESGANFLAPFAPGGESVSQLVQRVDRARKRIAEAHGADDDLLIVAHSGSVRGLLIGLLDLPIEAFWRFRPMPGSLSIVTVSEGMAVAELWNGTAHLGASHAG
jgi:broad specificity phosphatase PhoE